MRFLVTKENALEIAAFAEQCVNLDPLSEAIYVLAAKFLRTHFERSYDNVVKYFLEVEASVEVSHLLHKIMTYVALSPACDNCQSKACLGGKPITKDNFVPGAKFKTLPTGLDQRVYSAHSLHSLANSAKFMANDKDGNVIPGLTCSLNMGYYVYRCN